MLLVTAREMEGEGGNVEMREQGGTVGDVYHNKLSVSLQSHLEGSVVSMCQQAHSLPVAEL